MLSVQARTFRSICSYHAMLSIGNGQKNCFEITLTLNVELWSLKSNQFISCRNWTKFEFPRGFSGISHSNECDRLTTKEMKGRRNERLKKWKVSYAQMHKKAYLYIGKRKIRILSTFGLLTMFSTCKNGLWHNQGDLLTHNNIFNCINY